ncbi:MAG: ABC transporter ATP-binding protein, partial [Cyclobacteriaceae bacterium]|nr:ABC transporter ATP-binding protein [Cyclobacteriaceae bacterium]
MQKEKNSGNIIDFKVLQRLYEYIKPYSSRFYLLIILTIVMGVIGPIRPLLVSYAIDDHIAIGDYKGLLDITIILVILLTASGVFQYLHTYLSGWLGQYIIKDIRVKLYKHLLRMQLKFFDRTPIGRLVTRAVSDIETLSEVFSQGLAALIADVLQLVFILIFMFYLDWKLTLMSLSTFPLLVISTYIFKEKIKHAFNEVRNAVSNLNSFVQEHITGMSIVQIFNSEKREYKKFEEINKEHKRANIKTVLYYSIYYPV